jgi:hypothetical protein
VAWLAAVAVFQGGRLLTALVATASVVPASVVLPGVG